MEDLMFNLDDMNISEESLDFLSENKPPSREEQKTEESKENNAEEPSIEIKEGSGDEEKDNVDNEKQEGDQDDKETSQEDAPSSDDNSSHQSTLYALAQYLKEEGVLFIEDELKEVQNLDDLKELIKNSNERARYANLNESQRRYQEALENGVPVNEFEQLEKQIQTFTNIKEEDVANNPNLRYEIMAIDFMNQGIEQNRAMKLAKLSLSDESNVEDARAALNNIIENKRGEFRQLVDKSKTEYQTTVEDYKKEIFSREKLLDQKLNENTKTRLFDQITTRVDTDEQGRPLNELQKWQRDNPVESSIMMNYLFMMTNKGKDMSLINKGATSSAAKDLEKKLRNLSFDESGSLIIPDSMMRGSAPKQEDKGRKANKNNYTINI